MIVKCQSEILQSLYAALETTSKHQLTFSTEDTEISRLFKSAFAPINAAFSPTPHGIRQMLVPKRTIFAS